ncbi:MAG: hypothetical protein ACFFAJ_14740 [Candidatus Hodarchaeota archaeon]
MKYKIKTILLVLLIFWSTSVLVVNGLPEGKGVQKINPHVHGEAWPYGPRYSRGYYYVPWAPEEFSGTIKVGTWLTIGLGWWPGFPVHEDFVDDAIEFLIADGTASVDWLNFNGEFIDLEQCWRVDYIIVEPWIDEYGNPVPEFYYIYFPFRYYIPPQAKGTYEISISFFGSEIFEGYIEWAPASAFK